MSKAAISKEVASRLNAFSVNPSAEHVTIVGFDTDDGPEHPLFDERACAPLDEMMVRRMVKKGFTHGAIELRKNGDKLEVVVGRQRVKAARAANLLRAEDGLPPFAVRAFVRGVDGADALELLIAENEQRQSDGPLLKAQKCRRLMELGKNEEACAEAFGVEVQTIENWMRFFDLADEVQSAVKAGKAAFYAALGLADLSREEQVEALESLPAEGTATAKEIRAAAKRQRNKGSEEEVVERPGLRKIKRVLAAHNEDAFLAPDFAKALRWVLGEIGDNSVKGLASAARED